jgi:hypothetical protein
MHILVFDTETTGLPKSRKDAKEEPNNWPHLVSISWVVLDSENMFAITKQRNYIIKPVDWVIPEDSIKIHGITNEEASQGASLKEVMDEFMSEKINLEYRPNNYFWACDSGILLSSEIKGAKRKSLYELSVFDEDSVKYDELLFKPSLNDDERKDIGRLNPSFLGGEFLPDKNINEIEIARITINSVTSDVTSVFASRKDDKIYYRVVDEYDGDYLYSVSVIAVSNDGRYKNVSSIILDGIKCATFGHGDLDKDISDPNYSILSSTFWGQTILLIFDKFMINN